MKENMGMMTLKEAELVVVEAYKMPVWTLNELLGDRSYIPGLICSIFVIEDARGKKHADSLRKKLSFCFQRKTMCTSEDWMKAFLQKPNVTKEQVQVVLSMTNIFFETGRLASLPDVEFHWQMLSYNHPKLILRLHGRILPDHFCKYLELVADGQYVC